MREKWVNYTSNAPIVADFLSTNGLGAPLVLNTEEEALYYLAEGDVPTLLPDFSTPENFARNSQWEIMSASGYDTAWNELCTGSEAQLAFDSNTFGANSVTITRAAGFPSNWQIGTLFVCDSGDAALRQKPMRVTALTATTITFICPFNTQPAASIAGLVRPISIMNNTTGDAADGWSKDATLRVWRDGYSSNRVSGARYALSCVKSAGTTQRVYASVDITLFRGSQLSFGISARQRVQGGAGTWRVYMTCDGTGGTTTYSASSTDIAHNWLETTIAIPADATYCYYGIELLGNSGDAYCLCNPVLSRGRYIGSGNYTYPQHQLLPVVKVEPWVNASVTFGSTFIPGRGYQFPVDFYADSGGQIAPTVKMFNGNWEGINTNAVVTGTAGNRTFGFWQSSGDPTLIGFIVSQQVSNVKTYGKAQWFTDSSGFCQAVSFASADSWSNISIDINEFLLGIA